MSTGTGIALAGGLLGLAAFASICVCQAPSTASYVLAALGCLLWYGLCET